MLEKFGLKPYDDPEVEKAFNEHYFQHGRHLVMVFCFLSLFLTGFTFLRDIFFDNPDMHLVAKQLLRTVLVVSFASILLYLWKSKNLSSSNFQRVQFVLAALIVFSTLMLALLWSESFSDEAFSRSNSTTTIALIALCTLLRLPLIWLALMMAAMFVGMAYASWDVIQFRPRVWFQGQIFLLCGFILGLLTHITNRWNERGLFEMRRKIDKQLKAEAEASVQKSKFLAALSHDLRQPLTGLVGYLELAQTQIPKTDETKLAQYVKRAQNSADAINKNLTRVLEIARMQDVGSSINVRSTDLIELVGTIGRLFEAQLIAQNITLKIIRPQADPVYVETDFDLLFQVLQNLVSNALKHRRKAPVESVVIISIAQLLNGKTKISVVDNGTGIPRGELENIFKPYYQLNNPERQIEKGLGLGLAFVNDAIRKLPRHKIEVWSNEKSLTKFNLLIPSVHLQPQNQHLKQSSDRSHPKIAHAQYQLDRMKSLRVLIIEDDAVVRDFVNEVLSPIVKLVVAPVEITDVAKMEYLATQTDLIVCDHDLPTAMKGFALSAHLALTTGREIPTLIISGRSELQLPINRSGLDLLQKPFDATQLTDSICGLVSLQEPASQSKTSAIEAFHIQLKPTRTN
jgi:signal transduction histidine kinase/CheY-like chemotaxis protein